MFCSSILCLAATITLFPSASAASPGRATKPEWASSSRAHHARSSCSEGGDDVTILHYDVAVIGGGSGGVYTAMGLIDAGKDVVVIEKTERLGGHAHTYTDPDTGTPINYGVQILHNNDLVRGYFARFGLNTSVTPLGGGFATATPLLADFNTGEALTNVTLPSDMVAIGTALGTYATIAASYAPYLSTGFNLPDDMPEELLMPFGDFVTKYNISAALPSIMQINQGIGNLLEIPTVYVFQYLPADTVQYMQTGFLVPADGKITTLYDKAAAELGENVFLSSTVTAVDRTSSENVTLTVTTPSGVKTIVASRLVMAIQPSIDDLSPFLDLTEEESDIFSRFTHAGYWPMLVKDTGIPDNLAVNFYDPNTPYNLPHMPGAYISSPTMVPGLRTLYYASAQTSGSNPSKDDVLAEMTAGLARLATGGAVPTASSSPTVVVLKDHGYFCLQVSTEEISAGFYKRMNALQGTSKTFWTGATWIAHDSAQIWKFSAALIPNITASL